MAGADVIDIADVRFQRTMVRIHAGGPRLLGEILAELSAKRMLRTEIEALVARFAKLNPGILRAVEADQFPVSIGLVDNLKFALRRVYEAIDAADCAEIYGLLHDAAGAIEDALDAAAQRGGA